MSALDHASVEVPALAEGRRRRLPRVTPARAALAFVAAQVPLALAAIALEWRVTWGAPDDTGPIGEDVILHGSAISGPLQPQLIFLALAFLATRSGARIRTLGAVGIGVLGLLVVVNGAASALTEPRFAPQAASVIAGIGFAAAGAALAAIATRELIRRHEEDR